MAKKLIEVKITTLNHYKFQIMTLKLIKVSMIKLMKIIIYLLKSITLMNT